VSPCLCGYNTHGNAGRNIFGRIRGLMELHAINAIMSKDVITLGPDESLKSAVKKMNFHNVSCIVIVKDGKPIGILTERDIIFMKGNNVEFDTVLLQSVMRSPVIAISEETESPRRPT